MKRLAILSLLLVPSAAVGVERASAEAPSQVASQYNGHGDDAFYGGVSAAHGQPCGPTLCDPPACDEGGWFGDVGFYILRPQWGGNPAAYVTAWDAGGTELYSSQEEFDHDSDFAPLVSVGYAGSGGLGFRTRWWTLDSSDAMEASADGLPAGAVVDLTTPSLLGEGYSYELDADQPMAASARHELDLDVIDMEGLWETTLGRTSLLYSAGVRYAHLGQSYQAAVQGFDFFDGPSDDTFRATNTFNGAGPTASMQAYRQVGATDFSVYGLGRGALLFGERRQTAANSFNAVTRSVTNDAVLPVIELEVGTNWTRNMGGFDLFAESGFVGQVWFNAGNAANSDTLIGDDTDGTDHSNQDMGLVGLRYSTGVRF